MSPLVACLLLMLFIVGNSGSAGRNKKSWAQKIKVEQVFSLKTFSSEKNFGLKKSCRSKKQSLAKTIPK